jgi:hypothetical protein
MSNVLQIGTGVLTVKRRRPGVVVALSVVTLGVYQLVWYYKINREMRDFGSARGDRELGGSSPVRSVLAVTLGGLIVIPELISLIGTVKRVQRSERLGVGSAGSAVIPIALFIAGMILSIAAQFRGLELLLLLSVPAYLTAEALVQARLNRVWTAAGVAVVGSGDPAAPAPEDLALALAVSAAHDR